MEAQVIAPFIDKVSGKRVRPGDALPEGMAEDRLQKLERAGCVEIIGKREKSKSRRRKSAARGSAEPQTLFPDAEDTGGGAGVPTPPAGIGEVAADAGDSATDPASVAGADSGDTGAGPVADAAGREDGDGPGADDSGR